MNSLALVMHNNTDLCKTIQCILRNNDTDVIFTTSEIDAMQCLAKNECCIVIMGLSPSMDETLKIIQHIHIAKAVPILMLIENATASDKAYLLRAGANDYLEMPLDTEIFVAQVNSLIQLYGETQADNRELQPLVFGKELIIYPRYRQVILEGTLINLTRTEFDLLFYLAQHPGQVWSRSQLYRHVWKDTLGSEGENTVRTHIGNLRKKLANAGKGYVQTTRGIGYKFVPPDCK